MKRAKRIFAGLTALIVGVSVAAFVPACGDNPDKADVNGEIVTGDNPDNAFGNVDGNGEIVTGDNPDFANGSSSSGTKSGLVKTMEAVTGQSLTALSLSFNMRDTVTRYGIDDGTPGGKIDEEIYRNENMYVSVKMNKNVDADFLIRDPYNNSTYNNYAFIRDGRFLRPRTDGSAVTDFSGVAFESPINIFDDNVSGEFGPGYSSILSSFGVERQNALDASVVKTPFYTLLALAECYGGASYAEGSLTIDVNKIMGRMYADLLNIVDGLTQSTTIGNLYSTKLVKSVLQSVTYGMNVKQMYDSGLAQYEDYRASVEGLPAPTESDSYYTYLGKLLKEKKFTQIVLSSVTGSEVGASLVSPMEEMTIVDLISTVTGSTITAEELKTMVKGALSEVSIDEESLYIRFTDEGGVRIDNMKAVLSIDNDFKITALSATTDVTVREYRSYEEMYRDEIIKVTINLEVLNSANTLTNLSGAIIPEA